MQIVFDNKIISTAVLLAAVGLGTSCGTPAGNRNANAGNANTIVNSISNTLNSTNSANSNSAPSAAIEAKEPDQYQATVKIQFQATGNQQTTTLPAISANVAKNANQRMMEITLPNGEKIIYIDKDGTNYAILPNRKQYAELDKESLGIDVRRLLMPEQIVQQVKSLKGFTLVGEENVNGRPADKYTYQNVTSTQTQAGDVGTQAFVLVDKETGLPLHSETVSQSQSGANVKGYSGLQISTDITDIKSTADSALFIVPTDFQKVDAQQVRAQADMIFKIAGTFLAQMMQSAQTNTNSPNGANNTNNVSNTNTSAPANSAGK